MFLLGVHEPMWYLNPDGTTRVPPAILKAFGEAVRARFEKEREANQ